MADTTSRMADTTPQRLRWYKFNATGQSTHPPQPNNKDSPCNVSYHEWWLQKTDASTMAQPMHQSPMCAEVASEQQDWTTREEMSTEKRHRRCTLGPECPRSKRLPTWARSCQIQGLHEQPRQCLQEGDDTAVPPLFDPASRIKDFPRRSMWESTDRAMTTPPRRRRHPQASPLSAKSKAFARPICLPRSPPEKSSLEPTLGRTADERRAELRCRRRRCADCRSTTIRRAGRWTTIWSCSLAKLDH
jgi:hypothetical protein